MGFIDTISSTAVKFLMYFLLIIIAILSIIFSTTFRYIFLAIIFLVAAIYVIISTDDQKIKIIFGLLFFGMSVVMVFIIAITQTQFGSGLTILSVSKNIDVISTNTDLAGVWFLVNTKVSGLAGSRQYIVGTLTPEQTLNNVGYKTKYPLEIKVGNLNEQVEYKVSSIGAENNIYNYEYNLKYSSDGWDESKGVCKGYLLTKRKDAPACNSGYTDGGNSLNVLVNNNGIFGIGSSYYTCVRICYKKTAMGVIGDIQQTRVTDNLDVSLTANGKTSTKTVSQDSPHADFIVDGATKATVDYPSNGWTGNFVPSTSQFKAYWDNTGKRWTITSSQRITDYNKGEVTLQNNLNSRWNAQTKICSDKPTCSFRSINEYLNDINSEFDKFNFNAIKIATDDLSLSQDQTWGNRNDKNNGKLIIDIERQISVPELLFKIRADWIGVVITTGKPSILGFDNCEYFSGTTTSINVDVKNVGNGIGNFKASVDCDTSKQTYTTSAIDFDIGETKKLTIPVDSGTFAGKTNDQCVVTVQDVNTNSATTSQSTVCKIKAPQQCTEGEFTADFVSKCIYKCIEGEKVKQTCCSADQTILISESSVDNLTGNYFCQASNCAEGTQLCNDGVCRQSCEDKELNCKWYQLETVKDGYKYSVLGIFKFGKTTTPVCSNMPVYISLFLIAMILLIIIILLIMRGKK